MTVGVVEAVQRDLAEIGKHNPGLVKSGLAAMALALAAELDDAGNSATSKSMCAKTLLETLDRLRALAPEKPKENPLDEIRARREKRLAAAEG